MLRNDGGPVFDEGWQAQVLALAFNLVERGQFTSTQWSEALGAELVLANERGETDNSATYYQAVLSALEKLLELRTACVARSLINVLKHGERRICAPRMASQWSLPTESTDLLCAFNADIESLG